MGWVDSFFALEVLNVVTASLEGGGPTLPLWGRPWGRVVTYP